MHGAQIDPLDRVRHPVEDTLGEALRTGIVGSGIGAAAGGLTAGSLRGAGAGAGIGALVGALSGAQRAGQQRDLMLMQLGLKGASLLGPVLEGSRRVQDAYEAGRRFRRELECAAPEKAAALAEVEHAVSGTAGEVAALLGRGLGGLGKRVGRAAYDAGAALGRAAHEADPVTLGRLVLGGLGVGGAAMWAHQAGRDAEREALRQELGGLA